MPTVGPGVRELRVRVGREFRVLYVHSHPDAVYVLHVFEKKSQKTLLRDLDVARGRLSLLLQSRHLR